MCQGEFSRNVSPDPVQSTLPRLDTHPHAPFDSKSEDKEEITEPLCTDGTSLEIPEEQERGTYTPGSQKSTRKNLGSQPAHSVTFTRKDTIASGSVEYQFKMLNFELYILYSELYR